MSIGLFLLILLAIWLVPKLIRGYLFVHRIKKQARAMYEQMYNTGAADQPRSKTRRPGWSDPMKRRKKIDPEVGEYVKFQEIKVTETQTGTRSTTGSTETHYTIEQQITDAEWEDIR